jgi:RNA 2',3'-cyclic 3'-phosphodiesterase
VPEDSRIRSFVAVDVAAPVRAALQELLDELASAEGNVRWVRAQGVHVTLKFLGWVAARRLRRVRDALAAVAAAHAPVQLRLKGLGGFPSLRRPRVLWVGADGAGLAALARGVDVALAAEGFAAEARPFAPHLTLGRVKSLRRWPRLEALLQAHLSDDFGASPVEALTVYRSTLRSDGAVYTPLWTIPLTGNKEGRNDL